MYVARLSRASLTPVVPELIRQALRKQGSELDVTPTLLANSKTKAVETVLAVCVSCGGLPSTQVVIEELAKWDEKAKAISSLDAQQAALIHESPHVLRDAGV